ncbi:hypothetical protein ACOMHN_039409 [Nucella lapillus]
MARPLAVAGDRTWDPVTPLMLAQRQGGQGLRECCSRSTLEPSPPPQPDPRGRQAGPQTLSNANRHLDRSKRRMHRHSHRLHHRQNVGNGFQAFPFCPCPLTRVLCEDSAGLT